MHVLLQAIHIPLSYCAQNFLTMKDVKYVRDLAWSRATLHDSIITSSMTRVGVWKLALKKVEWGWTVFFSEKRATRIQGENFTILNGFADSDIDSGDDLQLSALASMRRRTFADLLTAVQNSFMAQDQTLWNPSSLQQTNLKMVGTLKSEAHA